MNKNFIIFTYIIFIAVCFQTAINIVNAEFRVSIFGGYTNVKSKSKLNIYDKILQYNSIFSNTADLCWPKQCTLKQVSTINGDTPDQDAYCYEQTTTLKGITYIYAGFCSERNSKVDEYISHIIGKLRNIFISKDGYTITLTPNLKVQIQRPLEHTGNHIIDGNRKLIIPNVMLSHKSFPNFSIELLNSEANIDFNYFFNQNPYPLQQAISKAIQRDPLEFQNEWNAAVPSTIKKNNFTCGLSAAYSESFFSQRNSTYGIYAGAEAYFEFTPNKIQSSGFSIKEKNFGIRPFVGITKKNNWTIYGIFGIKYSKHSFKADKVYANKGKLLCETGIGSDYFISDKISVSVKALKSIKSTLKVQNIPFKISSFKILFALNYHF